MAVTLSAQLYSGEDAIGDAQVLGVPEQPALANLDYGGATEDWNASLSRTLVNNELRVGLVASEDVSLSTIVHVDSIAATVHYTDAAGNSRSQTIAIGVGLGLGMQGAGGGPGAGA